MHRILILICLLFVMACSEKQQQQKPLTDGERQQIAALTDQLITSINGFDFAVVNNTWSNTAFKRRIVNITNTQQSVLDHLFEEDLKQTIKFGNLSIIHEVNDGRGKASLLNIQYFDYHAEALILLSFPETFHFCKYRIEMVKGSPVLSDFFQLKDNLWYSQRLMSTLKVNSQYDAFSEERQQANLAMDASTEALNAGDTLLALQYLYEVPDVYEVGSWLSVKKIDLAANLADTIFSSVIYTEYQSNQSLYVQYIYNYYFDTTALSSTYQSLEKELGVTGSLDSLVSANKVWY